MKRIIIRLIQVMLVFCIVICVDLNQAEAAVDSNVRIGDIVTFGVYEQDNNISNGKEPIEWQVLDVQGDKALLISCYALDNKPFNAEWVKTNWEKCSLRLWLNNQFVAGAFSREEENQILQTSISADRNPGFSTDAGHNTVDKVFLLSIQEVNRYFESEAQRACRGTPYCYAQGARKDKTNGNCEWYLRTPGGDQNCAAFIQPDGKINSYADVDDPTFVDRPALWVQLGKTNSTVRYCPECGKQIDISSKFCMYCGASVKLQ